MGLDKSVIINNKPRNTRISKQQEMYGIGDVKL